MIKDLKFVGEVICDSMDNEVMHRYTSHPERILVVLDGHIVHVGGKGPLVYYDIEDVERWLAENTQSTGRSVPAVVKKQPMKPVMMLGKEEQQQKEQEEEEEEECASWHAK